MVKCPGFQAPTAGSSQLQLWNFSPGDLTPSSDPVGFQLSYACAHTHTLSHTCSHIHMHSHTQIKISYLIKNRYRAIGISQCEDLSSAPGTHVRMRGVVVLGSETRGSLCN